MSGFDPSWLASAATRAYNAYGAAEAFRQSVGLPSWSHMASRAAGYFPARLPQSRYPALMPRVGYGGTYRRRGGRIGYFDHRRLPATVSRGPTFSQRRARRQAAGSDGVPPTRRGGRFRSNVAVLSRIPAWLMSSRGRRDVRL